MKTKFLKCTGCGHIHFGITEAEAVAEVESVSEYLKELSPDVWQSKYGGRMPSIERYKKCHTCGTSFEAFIPAIGYENSGMTMQAVIVPALAWGKNDGD